MRKSTFLAREDGGKTFFINNRQTFVTGCLSITEREQEILALLRQDPMIAQQELADRLGISRSALASHISSLMRQGYVQGRGYVLREGPTPW